MDIEKLLAQRKAAIDAALDNVLPAGDAAPQRLHRAMRYSVFTGGKRIRPILALESCRACGGTTGDVLDAACAIELIHTFSLIHDDLPAMDDDDYRRGKPTCHRKFDEATAILAGDSLLCLAFDIIARGRRPSIEVALMKELARSVGSAGMAGGQQVDIEYEKKKRSKDVLEYINIHKTAVFIKAAIRMGAIAAGAAASDVRRMEKFGICIGEAFQIIDDMLDNGDSVRVLGKDGAEKKAKALTKRADAAVGALGGRKAGTLKAISRYLLERRI